MTTKVPVELSSTPGIVDGSNATAITIDSSENVGIGVTPDSEPRLHVHKASAGSVASATNSVLTLENSTTAILQFLTPNSASAQIRFGDPQDTGAGYIQYGHSDNSLQFSANGPEKMRIDSSGNVGLGTSSPQEKLHVFDSSGTASIRVSGENNNNRACEIGYDASDGPYVRASSSGINSLKFFTDKTGHRMTIDGSGNIGAPTGTNIYNASDERLKQNITSLDNSLETIKNLNPVKFNWIDNFSESENGKTLYGFVAQEVQDVFPDAIEPFGDGKPITVEDEVIENPLTVREKFLVPMLVKAIQELEARIKTLEDA